MHKTAKTLFLFFLIGCVQPRNTSSQKSIKSEKTDLVFSFDKVAKSVVLCRQRNDGECVGPPVSWSTEREPVNSKTFSSWEEVIANSIKHSFAPDHIVHTRAAETPLLVRHRVIEQAATLWSIDQFVGQQYLTELKRDPTLQEQKERSNGSAFSRFDVIREARELILGNIDSGTHSKLRRLTELVCPLSESKMSQIQTKDLERLVLDSATGLESLVSKYIGQFNRDSIGEIYSNLAVPVVAAKLLEAISAKDVFLTQSADRVSDLHWLLDDIVFQAHLQNLGREKSEGLRSIIDTVSDEAKTAREKLVPPDSVVITRNVTPDSSQEINFLGYDAARRNLLLDFDSVFPPGNILGVRSFDGAVTVSNGKICEGVPQRLYVFITGDLAFETERIEVTLALDGFRPKWGIKRMIESSRPTTFESDDQLLSRLVNIDESNECHSGSRLLAHLQKKEFTTGEKIYSEAVSKGVVVPFDFGGEQREAPVVIDDLHSRYLNLLEAKSHLGDLSRPISLVSVSNPTLNVGPRTLLVTETGVIGVNTDMTAIIDSLDVPKANSEQFLSQIGIPFSCDD